MTIVSSITKLVILFFALTAVTIGIWISLRNFASTNISESIGSVELVRKDIHILPTPEISGWIPWWKEEPGYNQVEKYSSIIKSVSPVWFMVGKDMDLTEVGDIKRDDKIQILKESGVEVAPSLGSELTRDELSEFLNDEEKKNTLIKDLTKELTGLGVDGLDVDLENIKLEDRDKFSEFLEYLANSLRETNLKIYITVHAQTGKNIWQGTDGQDIKRIGDIADEVRVMAYDQHSAGTQPGSIASIEWIKDVASYNLLLVNRSKLVIGIPSYAYIWTENDTHGYQYDELYDFLKDRKYSEERDKTSGELIIKGDGFVGWLSDSQAMVEKIESLRKMGISKFVIWSFGGMDERLFETNWQ